MFQQARLRLTVWYLLIIMTVSLAFSFVIYTVIMREAGRIARSQQLMIERRLRGYVIQPAPPQPGMDTQLEQEVRRRVLFLLAVINGTILAAGGGFGYILAGKTLDPIRQMVDEQNRFVSDASHELRTPLTSLKTAMEVSLRDKNITLQETKDLIRENITDVNNLQLLSDKLLQLTHYDKPADRTVIAPVMIAGIVNEAVRRVAPLAKQKNIAIEKKTTETEIEADKQSLIELLIILLDNAIKYSHDHGVIRITSEKKANWVYLRVSDSGIGIGEKDIPRIFDRFYRADSARSRPGNGGYGLGLAIAKKIADTHFGSISVKSRAGKGSEFTVKLPVKHHESLISPPLFS